MAATSSNPFDAKDILDGIRRWVEIETPTEAPAQVNKLADLVAEGYRDLPATIERIAGTNGCGDHLVARSAWGRDAPGMTGLRQALEESRGLVQMILERRSGETSGANAPEAQTDSVDPGAPVRTAAPATRDTAYRQLEQAAITLERIEPHSPVPYLIRRAVELGKLPFPQMIKALIREANVLAELNRELGIKEPGGEVHSG